MHEQVSGGLTALPPDGSGGERGDKGGEPLPPAPMKKQEARPPPSNFQPPPRLPCLSPRGGAWVVRGPLWGRQGSLGRGLVAPLFPMSLHHPAAEANSGRRGWEGSGTQRSATPPPPGPVLSPRRRPARPRRAGGRAGGRERERGRAGRGARPEARAPPALRHLPRLLQLPGPRPEQL